MTSTNDSTAPFWGDTPPATPLSPAEAEALAREHFGVTATATPLGSNQETNLLLTAESGERWVLKLANPAFGADVLDLQNAALRHLAAADTGLAAPVPVPCVNGSDLVEITLAGVPHHLRLLTFVPGRLLADATYAGDKALEQFGALSARLAAALADFDHPAADRVLQYDSQHADRVVATLAHHLDDEHRARALAASERAWTALRPLTADLRRQVVHADLADYNVVAAADDAGRLQPSGVIDFGDVVRTWLVADLATAIASLLSRTRRSPLLDAAATVRGFHAVTPLTEPEVAALWPLVLARGAVLATSVDALLAQDPTNDYLIDEQSLDWLILDRAAQVPFALAEAHLRQVCGFGPGEAARAVDAWRPAAALIDLPADVPVIDLAITTTVLTEDTWTDPALARVHLEPQLPETGYAVVGPGARLTSVVRDSPDETASHHLGVDLIAPVGTDVRAPADGVLDVRPGGGVVLNCGAVDLQLTGLEPLAPGTYAAGAVIGTVSAAVAEDPLPAHLHVHLAPAGVAVPDRVEPSLSSAWETLSPATALLPTGAPEAHADLLTRRATVLARVQEHYYARPPQIERGWRHHLLDTQGRAYLDMVNNVAVLGHSHPAVTAAATRQYRLLNTNSRFSYEAMVTFAERIVEHLPAPLDTVFLVSSGSEAVDLALRIARTATGRKDTISLAGAYHGWTTAADEVSTTLNDNPRSRETRPPWIHLATMPNPFRGEYLGADAADRYADDVRRIVAAIPGGPGVFIAEPISGNQGGVELSPGYLPQVYEAVRGAGGLVISDEVQLGYGRTGEAFWGFQLHGVVPDIITMAKAAGNGHPLGFVATRREIAEQFSAEGSFFSSVGGSPVSSVVGTAVLDTIRDEGLQENAARIGAHLTARLRELAAVHPMVGYIHGRGLYQGIELVRDLDTLEPATREAAALNERLRELGVIEHATGDYSNVLKVKPPLTINEASVDFFVDRLDQALREGW